MPAPLFKTVFYDCGGCSDDVCPGHNFGFPCAGGAGVCVGLIQEPDPPLSCNTPAPPKGSRDYRCSCIIFSD